MKTAIKIFLILSISSFLCVSTWYSECKYESWANIMDMLKWCEPDTLIKTNNYTIDKKGGVRTRIARLTRDIIKVWALLFVGGIVFSWILWITSVGKDEQMSTAKTAFIWCIIWFIAMVSVYPLVNIAVKLIFDLWES